MHESGKSLSEGAHFDGTAPSECRPLLRRLVRATPNRAAANFDVPVPDFGHGVVRIFVFLHNQGDATACGKQNVDASRFCRRLRFRHTDAIVPAVLVLELDLAVRRYLQGGPGAAFLVCDCDCYGLREDLFCFCCSCCRHAGSPFEAYCFPPERKLGSARSPCRMGRRCRSIKVEPFLRLSCAYWTASLRSPSSS